MSHMPDKHMYICLWKWTLQTNTVDYKFLCSENFIPCLFGKEILPIGWYDQSMWKGENLFLAANSEAESCNRHWKGDDSRQWRIVSPKGWLAQEQMSFSGGEPKWDYSETCL